MDVVYRYGNCGREWTPRVCRSSARSPAARWRSPIDHLCLIPRAFPHICVCVRCGDQTAAIYPPQFRQQRHRPGPWWDWRLRRYTLGARR